MTLYYCQQKKKILKQTKANLFVIALPNHINEIIFNKRISITLYIHIKSSSSSPATLDATHVYRPVSDI